MKSVATTRLSSKGQVVIPEGVRRDLNLRPGDQFVVVGRGDVIILKTLSPPHIKRFDQLIRQARLNAKKVGLTKKHVHQAILRARHNP